MIFTPETFRFVVKEDSTNFQQLRPHPVLSLAYFLAYYWACWRASKIALNFQAMMNAAAYPEGNFPRTGCDPR